MVGLALVLCAVAAGCRQETTEPEPQESTDGAPATAATVSVFPDGADVPTGDGAGSGQAPAGAVDESVPTTTQVPASTTTTTTTLLPWSIPEAQAAQVAELMAMTERLRGRAYHRRPAFETLTGDELAERYPAGPGAPDHDELRRQMAFLRLVGMLPDGSGSVEAALEALDPPLSAPFYDFPRATVVIPGGGEELDEYQQWVLVGELVHALAHQHEPLLVGSVRGVGTDQDRTAARLALLEGEAALVQALYLDGLPPERRAEVARQAGERTRPVRDSVPPMLLELARFPYHAGSVLATELYRLGGMAALDQALGQPPASTEQVLHLGRYRHQDQPVAVAPLDLSVEGYEAVEAGTWGEWRWLSLFEHHSGPTDAAVAAEGWGGDHYVMLWEPTTENLVFAVRCAADSFADESEMITAIRDLITVGMEVGASRVVDTVTEWADGADYAMLAWDVGEITLVLASDPVAGRTAAIQLGVMNP